MSKIVFLDIDGVLNSVGRHFAGVEHCYWYDGIDETSFKLVQRVCEFTGARIVISSTWRKDGIDIIRGAFAAFGWRECSSPRSPMNPIIDVTGKSKTGNRGQEIAEWLAEHPEVENYVIIDDDSDMTDEQKANHFVHTDAVVGFTVYDAVDAIRLLGCHVSFEQEFKSMEGHVNFKRNKMVEAEAKRTAIKRTLESVEDET